MEMRDVVGYEGLYKVSDDGRVFSLISNQWMSLYPITRRGDLGCNLSKDGKSKTWLVHRLVCFAFHGNPPSEEYEVDHIDGNFLNNKADNLRWLTPEDNKAHYYEMNEAIMRPVVGFNEGGDVIRFENPQAAKDAGFGNVYEVLHRKIYLNKGYAFVFEDEWPLPIGVYFEQMEEVKVRRARRKSISQSENNRLKTRLVGTSVVDGSVVEFPDFVSAREAGYGSVDACLRGDLKTCGKRTWEAPDGYEPRETKPGAGRKPAQVRLVGTSLENGSTVEFGSFREAREAGFPSVRDCIVGKTRTCGGYTWEAPDGYEPRKYNKGVA